MNVKNNKIGCVVTVLLGICLASCDGFLQIEAPRNQLVTANIFENDDLANGAVAGIYGEMSMGSTAHFANGGNNSVTPLLALAVGELHYNLSNAELQAFEERAWLPTDNKGYVLWSSLYKSIFRANEVLEGLAMSKGVRADLSAQLRGEALFVRAFCHFYGFQLFGPVPLVLTADYRVTQSLPREPEAEVYAQLEKDLVEAIALLPADYSHALNERVRPNRWAATQLLARVYLYQGKWAEAEVKASEVIAQSGLYDLEGDPNQVFLKSSKEAVWQLLPVSSSGTNTNEGFDAIVNPLVYSAPAYSLTEQLLNSFETDDERKANWVSYYKPQNDPVTYSFPFKYKIWQGETGQPKIEYSMVLRLTEVYLIRAEARAQLGNLIGGLADVNAIRVQHGGLPELSALDKEGLMAAIERERQIEFFYEWGHRWFDQKRWGRHEQVLPIPQRELDANPNLEQNGGY